MKRILCANLPLVLLLTFSGSLQATASCSDRPGTPNQESAVAVSDTEIKLGWRVNTSGKIWYDIAVRDQNNPNDTSKDLAGVPGNKNEFQRGLTDERVIKNLKKSTNYCFVNSCSNRIRQRRLRLSIGHTLVLRNDHGKPAAGACEGTTTTPARFTAGATPSGRE